MDKDDRFVTIDYRDLSADALRGLVEELITRQGTDYGAEEARFETKVEDVYRRLAADEARIVFDTVDEHASIVSTEAFLSSRNADEPDPA